MGGGFSTNHVRARTMLHSMMGKSAKELLLTLKTRIEADRVLIMEPRGRTSTRNAPANDVTEM